MRGLGCLGLCCLKTGRSSTALHDSEYQADEMIANRRTYIPYLCFKVELDRPRLSAVRAAFVNANPNPASVRVLLDVFIHLNNYDQNLCLSRRFNDTAEEDWRYAWRCGGTIYTDALIVIRISRRRDRHGGWIFGADICQTVNVKLPGVSDASHLFRFLPPPISIEHVVKNSRPNWSGDYRDRSARWSHQPLLTIIAACSGR